MPTANTLLTIGMITRDAAAALGNELDLVKRVNRDHDSDFGVKSAQIGQVINIRRPIQPTVRTGNTLAVQPIIETYSPLTFGQPIGCDYQLTSQELTFSVEDYLKKVVEPTTIRLASQIELGGHAVINGFYNTIGTPGTALTSATARTSITKALALLNKNLAPRASGRKTALIDPDFNAVLTDSNSALFNPAAEIAKMYTDGYQGDFSSFMFFMNQLVGQGYGTTGTYGGTPLTNYGTPFADNSTWSQTSTLVTDGWTATSTVLNAGTGFTIAGVYAVNPVTKAKLSYLKQFVVAAPTVTDGSGNSTITVSPAIITSGGFQNVDSIPANNAAITVLGATGVTSTYATVFDRDAIMMAAKELVPYSVGFGSTVTDDQTGIPIRVQQMPDINTNVEILRFDVQVAWAPLYDQLGAKVWTT